MLGRQKSKGMAWRKDRTGRAGFRVNRCQPHGFHPGLAALRTGATRQQRAGPVRAKTPGSRKAPPSHGWGFNPVGQCCYLDIMDPRVRDRRYLAVAAICFRPVLVHNNRNIYSASA